MSVSRVSLFLVIALLYMECCYTASIPRNFDPRLSDEMVLTPKKRPFCNAFTGCGRKRSSGAPGMPSQEMMRQKQIPRNFDPRLSDEMVLTPKKRPFCNAFTGCGRKRSSGAPGMPSQEMMRQKQYVDDETLGPILETDNASIEELSRQILSEAKLWEAIQEASAEIARRKQKEFSF